MVENSTDSTGLTHSSKTYTRLGKHLVQYRFKQLITGKVDLYPTMP